MASITAALGEDQYTFFISSRSVLPRMGNVSGTPWRESQNTHFMCNNFFPRKSSRLWDNVEKCGKTG